MSWSLRSFIPFRSLFSLAQSPCTCSTNQNVISYTLLLISFKSPVHLPQLKFWGKSSEQAQVWVPKRTRRRTPRLQARPQRRKKGEVARPRRRSGPRVKPGDVFYGLMKDELTWAFEPWQPWLLNDRPETISPRPHFLTPVVHDMLLESFLPGINWTTWFCSTKAPTTSCTRKCPPISSSPRQLYQRGLR